MPESSSATLNGKRGIVTGAGSGIGREISLLAIAAGATVVGLDISQSSLEETAAAAREGAFVPAVCDVSDAERVDRVLSEVIDAGDVDFLVNAAGIEDSGDGIADMSVGHWDRLMGINLRGPFLTMKKILPVLQSRSAGSIVNLGSVASLAGWAELACYSAAKHGIVGLSKSAVAEYARYGVRINVVCPGPIDTPLQDRAEANAPDSAEFRRRQEAAIPQGRYGRPDEVADLVVFLLSDRAGYINGATISIDGGMIATG